MLITAFLKKNLNKENKHFFFLIVYIVMKIPLLALLRFFFQFNYKIYSKSIEREAFLKLICIKLFKIVY